MTGERSSIHAPSCCLARADEFLVGFAAGRQQRRSRRLDVECRRAGREGGGVQLLLPCRFRQLGQLALLGCDRPRLAEMPCPRARASRLFERRSRLRDLRVGRSLLRLGRGEPRRRFGVRAAVERQRIHARHHRALRNGIARIEREARHPPGDRRGDHEAIAHPRAALLLDGDLQAAALHRGHRDPHRRRAQDEHEERDHDRTGGERPRACQATRASLRSLPRLQHFDQIETVEPPPHDQPGAHGRCRTRPATRTHRSGR